MKNDFYDPSDFPTTFLTDKMKSSPLSSSVYPYTRINTDVFEVIIRPRTCSAGLTCSIGKQQSVQFTIVIQYIPNTLKPPPVITFKGQRVCF